MGRSLSIAQPRRESFAGFASSCLCAKAFILERTVGRLGTFFKRVVIATLLPAAFATRFRKSLL